MASGGCGLALDVNLTGRLDSHVESDQNRRTFVLPPEAA